MSKSNQLFLLADHIKLSLLERQRAQSLNLDNDTQDGHLSRSLDQFRDGLAALKDERTKLEQAGDTSAASSLADAIPSLQRQLDDLTSQFHGFSSPSTTTTLTSPNEPSLAADFAHATSTTSQPAKKSLRAPSTNNPSSAAIVSPKTVRFTDSSDADVEAQLFGRYRDEPPQSEYRDSAQDLNNEQLHAYHNAVLSQQDEQLDRLGESIGRQRELSMRIGDELDHHVEILDDTDTLMDRHQSRLDRARKQLGHVAKTASESKQMVIIFVLIVVLVLLIAVFK